MNFVSGRHGADPPRGRATAVLGSGEGDCLSEGGAHARGDRAASPAAMSREGERRLP